MFKFTDDKKHILLVDDDRSITQMLSMLLETRGYRVSIASSGEEAFKLVSQSPDLIVLDLILPDQDGFNICRMFKEQTHSQFIPIIILSARMLSEDITEGLYLGADDYLTKPFEYEELVARMEAVMRRSCALYKEEHKGREFIINEIRRIINYQLITPFFQPIFTLEPFKIYGYEALSRPHSSTMLLNPEVLFKAAINFGLYENLEYVAWQKAIEYSAKLLRGERLFLNCNPHLVESEKFVEFESIFKENRIKADKIVLEITERSAISDFKVYFGHLRKYREGGYRFAVDDVGGGFASLESIVETSPEYVKIDRHIISGLESNKFKRSIVKFIIDFSKENSIISIAEGVETRGEFDTLKSMGIDAIQGYFLCRPHPYIDSEHSLSEAIVQLR
ncbi:MAG: EAL domain-containing protein [Candidatus Omnitrophica bacterium]|nr:EAL domain-containing protein [Candidatus Omnitrophota bacterium]